MRKTPFAAAAIIAVSVSLSACSTSTDSSGSSDSGVSASSSAAPSAKSPSKTVDLSGSFTGLNGKTVSGTVQVSSSEIVLSGFASDEGPDLHVYLTSGTDEAAVSSGMELGSVAFNKASQTFQLEGVAPTDYENVVIHCDKAKAVFGAATLS